MQLGQPQTSSLPAENKRRDISAASLLDRITEQYLSWDRYAPPLGSMSTFPNMLDPILKFTDEDTIKKIAKDIVGNSGLKDAS